MRKKRCKARKRFPPATTKKGTPGREVAADVPDTEGEKGGVVREAKSDVPNLDRQLHFDLKSE